MDPKPRETLSDLLLTGPLPPEHAAPLGASLARAIARSHRAGRTHPDLDPDRIAIVSAPHGALRVRLDAEGPPGDPAADRRALARVLRTVVGWGSQVPPTLDLLVERASPDHPDAFRSADEVARALALWVPTPDPPEPRVPLIRRLVDPVRPVLVAVGVVLICVGAARIGVAAVEQPSAGPREVFVPAVPTATPPVPAEIEGVIVDPDRANAVLAFVAAASPDELRAAGLSSRAVDGVLAGRPFPSLDALALVPGIGPGTLGSLVEHAP